MKQRIASLILLLFFLSFGLVYYLDVRTLPEFEERLIIDLLFWLLIPLLALEASKIIYGIIKNKKCEKNGNVTKGSKVGIRTLLYKLASNKQFVLVVFLVFYLLIIPYLGFFATSLIFLVTLNLYLGSAKIKEFLFIPLVTLAVSYFVFVFFLDVRLPSGFLF
ncbi:tripartite tricarboxylate transporter TctB family protein [Salicibibacter cibarius]|uniref:Tripartite tricarboxylate transporter TctB family protein n=1 Tax=Salicibibacter cibarius TaxID=2743000 RepID=A0A7T6Z6P8_9BACI|nr:tripartite tricarboxylate transporter TctB family protein [Salicibibacter cibarius]QQK77813.1 tripartite tricarboxylate transporter TctB family protein [Salicibibacter cibarius]